MFKIFTGVYLGCVLAGITLFFIQKEYVIYKADQVIKDIRLQEQSKKDALIKAENIKNVQIESAISDCITAANKHHNDDVILINVARRGLNFIAINYSLKKDNNKLHAQCFLDGTFTVID